MRIETGDIHDAHVVYNNTIDILGMLDLYTKSTINMYVESLEHLATEAESGEQSDVILALIRLAKKSIED